MMKKETLEKIKKERKQWEQETYAPLIKKHPERKKEFHNLSATPIKQLYTPEDIKDDEYPIYNTTLNC